MNTTCKNINHSVEYDPIRSLIGQIVKCKKLNDKFFCARLIAVTPSGELWFETRTGRRMMDKRASIASTCPYEPYSPEVEA
jgi:hypothetical protein